MALFNMTYISEACLQIVETKDSQPYLETRVNLYFTECNGTLRMWHLRLNLGGTSGFVVKQVMSPFVQNDHHLQICLCVSILHFPYSAYLWLLFLMPLSHNLQQNIGLVKKLNLSIETLLTTILALTVEPIIYRLSKLTAQL